MNAQFNTTEKSGHLDKIFMGIESLSRKRSQEARNRRESNTRRQDSQ